jgi:hypothetical protein
MSSISTGAFERFDLPAERVAPHGHLDPAEGLLVFPAVQDPGGEHDHAGARAVDRHPVGDALADGVQKPEVTARLLIVVDSPPGMTSASTASSSSGRRTGRDACAALGQRPLVLTHVALQGRALRWSHYPPILSL